MDHNKLFRVDQNDCGFLIQKWLRYVSWSLFFELIFKMKKEWNDFQVEFDSAGTQTDFSLENLGLNLIQR